MGNAIVVDFDDWIQDLEMPSGEIIKDVTFVRAKSGDLEYHAPIMPPVDNLEQEKKDLKALLFIKISLEKGMV